MEIIIHPFYKKTENLFTPQLVPNIICCGDIAMESSLFFA